SGASQLSLLRELLSAGCSPPRRRLGSRQVCVRRAPRPRPIPLDGWWNSSTTAKLKKRLHDVDESPAKGAPRNALVETGIRGAQGSTSDLPRPADTAAT